MSNCTNITECRLCGSSSIYDIFSFGPVAPANNYIAENDIDKKEEKFTLTPVRCNSCGHIQIRETIDRESLFSNYLYSSSTSGSLLKYFESYANDLIELLNLDPESGYILDIGSNDGVTLSAFKKRGFKVLGVEPAKNLSKIANDNGIETINTFFDKDVANDIFSKYGYPSCIISNNTYAHIEKHHEFTEGILVLLNDFNSFTFENAHLLPTIKNLYFDQFYHDHLGYYWLGPLGIYFNSKGLQIFNVKVTEIQGGSIRVNVCKKGSKRIDESVWNTLKSELDFGLNLPETYIQFKARMDDTRDSFLYKINEYLKNGKSISCYGCPAKFSTLSKFFNLSEIGIKYVVDDSKFKQGLYSPESKIKIVDKQYFIDNPTDVCIISAWNFEDLIKKSNPQYKGDWINPFK